MRNINPKIRITLYIAVCAVGGVLVAWGIVTQDIVNAIAPIAAGILAVGGGGLAAANTSVRPADQNPSVPEWVGMGTDLAPTILAELQRLRGQLAAQPAQGVVNPAIEYVPDVAPWLSQAQETLGQAQGVASGSVVNVVGDASRQINEAIGRATGVEAYVGAHRAQ